MPRVRAASFRERRGPAWVTVEQMKLDARQDVPEYRQMRMPLDPGPDQRGPHGPALDHRTESPHREAGDRGGSLGRDRAAVHDRQRDPRGGVVDDHQGTDARQPELVVRGEPGDPFHADEVAEEIGAAEHGRHRVEE